MESSYRLCGAFPRCRVIKFCGANVWGVAWVVFTSRQMRKLLQSIIRESRSLETWLFFENGYTSVPKNNEYKRTRKSKHSWFYLNDVFAICMIFLTWDAILSVLHHLTMR